MAMDSWIQVSKNSGSGNAQINATATKNTADTRSTIITIKAAGLTKTVNCNQAAAPKYSLSVSASTVNSSGGTITNIGNCGITSVSGSKTGSFFENTSCTVVAKAAPTGYTFDGWYDGGNKVVSQLEFTFTLTTNRVLVAKYRINTYTITWNANGGTVNPTSTTKEYNSTLGSLPTPTRAATAEYNYTFNGWFTASTGGNKISESTTVTASITYYAQWTATKRSYTLTYNPNGGSVTPTTKIVAFDAAIGDLPTPTKAADNTYTYTFAGWWTATTGGTQVSASTIMGAANRTIYARWTSVAKVYTLITTEYYMNESGSYVAGTTGGTATNPTGGYNENVTSTASANTGFTFAGFFTAATGGSSVTMPTSIGTGKTIYARFSRNKYTFTFDANGGNTPSQASIQQYYNVAVGSLPTCTRTSTAQYSYTFVGWFDTAASTGGTQLTTSTKITSNKTWYARWTATTRSYTATFNGNGGGTPNPSTITKTYGTALGTLPTCSRTGYTFNGWFTASSGGTKISTATTVTANVTYYAQWTINSYTLTYNANGGTVSPTSKSLNYGAAYGTLPTPTRASTAQYSYSFKGWFTSATGGTQVSTSTTMGAGNVTIYAQWNQTLRSYTISYQTNYGSVSKSSESVNYGSTGSCSVTIPSDTAQYDYIFVGWFTQANGAGTKVGTSTTLTTPTISGAVTYYAYITRTVKSYTHTFTGGTPGTITKQYGQALGTLPTATKASTAEYNYTFVGWFDTNAASGGTQATTGTTVTGTKTWYPRFTAVKRKYTITANSNNTNYGIVSGGGIYDYGTNITLTAIHKSGYRLKQWEDGSTATSRQITVTGNKTYTAIFEAIPYLNLNKTELVFESTGGTQTVTVESNVSWTVS